jgi:peptidoglycan/LPS O-acetylase OafA/YrhL
MTSLTRGTGAELRLTGSETHRLDVEGLRAVAVAIVILFHANIPFMAGGYVGVDVFFVISGFLITGLIVREMEQTGTVGLVRFYARRIRRLLPALVLTLVAAAILTALVLSQTRWDGIAGDIRWSSGYLVNWRFAGRAVDYLAVDVAPSPVQHFWSLAVEEQFYLVWPFLLLVATLWARRRGRDIRRSLAVGLSLVAIPSLVWSIHLTPVSPGSAYFITTTRMWELAIGGGLAIFAPSLARMPRSVAEALTVAGLVGILLASVMYGATTLFPGYAAMLPVMATAAVIAAGTAHQGTLGAKLLSLPPIVVVGGFSYALYLWHWPLLVAATAMWGELSIPAALLVVAAATVVSWISYRRVEQPIRKSDVIVTPPRRGLFFGLVLTGVGLIAGVWLGAMVPNVTPLDAVQQAITLPKPTTTRPPATTTTAALITATSVLDATTTTTTLAPPEIVVQVTAQSIVPDPLVAREDLPAVYADGCHQNQTDPEPISCRYGTDSGPVVALVGDSHAAMWVPAFRVLADEYEFQLITYTKSSCGLAAVDWVVGEQRIPYASCFEWNKLVLEALTGADRPDLVVTSLYHRLTPNDSTGEALSVSDSQPVLARGLAETWRLLEEAGVPLVAIRDVPTPGFDVPACVSDNRSRLDECAFDRSEIMAENTAEVVAAEQTGVQLIDLTDWICGQDLCPAVINNLVVWRDTHHLTATYARYVAPALAYELEEYLVADAGLDSPPRQ